jgi:hypothetical protein
VVGRDHYVLALAADHGVTDIPEQLKQAGRDAGRVSTTGVLNAAEDAAEAALGPGKYFARMNSNDIYMTPGMYDRVRQSPKAMKAIIDALEKQPGVHRAFPADVMAASAHSSDREKRAAALSYVSGRSGDFVIAARPGWVVNNTGGTTHGSPTADDQRVPIVLFGADIKAGRYSDSVTPADVAPTLALLAHIPLPAAEGHPLKEALR